MILSGTIYTYSFAFGRVERVLVGESCVVVEVFGVQHVFVKGTAQLLDNPT